MIPIIPGMITRVDRLLDRITMYRLVLYLLIGYVGVAAILAVFGRLPFTAPALLVSAAILVAICWAANTILARLLDVPANVESSFITALILALILDPARSPGDLQLLGWAAILAMSSKYLIALRNKHIFNPAALAVAITSFAIGESASWWVGTGSMLPVVLLGGLLLVRKLRQEALAGAFLAAALAAICVVSLLLRLALPSELQLLLVASPLFFFASVMLTEPLTAPPTQRMRLIYGALVGVLFIPQIHIGTLYSTPELALLVGNVFSYLVGPKLRPALELRKKTRLAPNVVDFAFKPSAKLAFLPGQYMEFTLAHPHPDGRGNRRYFTLASSPTEDVVRLGVRFYPRGSSFKRGLQSLGARAKIAGGQVAGDFTLPTDPRRKLVFIAGGIGITPYRSMLKYLLDTRQRCDIVLLYANRVAADIVYKDVLDEAQAKLGVKTVYTLTDTAALPRDWPGAKGRIGEKLIRAAAPDYSERTFYISGPPDMVRASERVLRNMGIRATHIKKDFFPGLV
jgi:ferredoxin-NADP reductase/Na+-translocating ferredoxin:NAD+ oxidoreductase RnfD subunit